MGRRRIGRGGGRWIAEGGIKQDSKSSAVPSVCDINCYNLRGWPRLLLGAVWFTMQFYYTPQGREMPPCGSTASVKSCLRKQTWSSISTYVGSA